MDGVGIEESDVGREVGGGYGGRAAPGLAVYRGGVVHGEAVPAGKP